MGIPKAFRWLSERYPLISQLIEEDRIPEFDNLYLDMNGIVHNCSHNNNEDVSFRISEEQIFLNVFAYIEHLFSKIKPKKLFFMAIDGVAPRAKMNQQRSRRFRAAKDVNDRILEAKRKGEDLPDDGSEAFQSNMITPGTPFMARLTANLRYFVNKKVSEDANWRGVQVVLSGHEVPGEGEHKIMEYIRLAKAQPAYDPNTRHCLYGLDADLIMLGLLSHDPHFCLLREEVLFGPARAKAASRGLESTNFYLMHLSLLREYLDIEFSDLKPVMPSSNPYDLERIIDDFILLAIFIGNDFLPHLPGLHINEGALNLLFDIYKRVVPTAGGYLNEHGLLAKDRLQKVLDHLAEFEREKFEEEQADSTWLRLKHAGRDADKLENKRAKGKLVVTKAQRQLLKSIKTFITSNIDEPSLDAQLQLPSLETQDRRFLQQLGDELKLDIAYDEFDSNDEPIVVVRLSQEIVDMIEEAQDDQDVDDEDWEDTDDQESDPQVRTATKRVEAMDVNNGKTDSEWLQAVQRIFAKYESAPNARQTAKSKAEHDQDYHTFVSDKLHAWKSDYYRDKLRFDIVKQPQSLKDMAYAYIEGIQWVLHYYYDGVASWSWYYPYHYSPKISDLVEVGSMRFDFDLNIPFTPFQQLMGVLPGLSSNLVPAPYRDLMLDANSPIIDFYPLEFEQDMNGKKQDWEAIVKIPFLDANRLVKTMATRESRLTDEERERNSFGNSYTFIYDSTYMQTYPTSSPGFFPDLHNCHCRMEVFNLPTLGGLRLVKGLCEGALLGKDMLPGFPSLYTLPVIAKIAYHSVNVFQADSRNESVVLTVDNAYEGISVDQVAQQLLGKHTYVAWPFLREAKVTAVSDEERKYTLDARTGAMTAALQSGEQKEKWRRAAGRVAHVQSKRYAVDIDQVDVLVHVQPLKGLKRLDDGAHIKEWIPTETEHAIQTTVSSVMRPDPRYQEQPAMPVELEFPQGSKVFFLGPRNYGSPSVVVGHSKGLLTLQLGYFPSDEEEPRKFAALASQRAQQRYFPSFAVTKRVGMSALTLSKITSGLMIEVAGSAGRVNVGLNLKFEAKAQKVLGYAQRNEHGWEYSEKAIALIQEYKESFPEIVSALDARRGDLTKASDFFPQDTDARVSDIKAWIKEKGVRDFEKVSLYSDQMEKEAVWQTQDLQDQLYAAKTPESMKNAVFKNLPRRMVLKPEHAAYQLQHQSFTVGARVITCQETGSVPLGVKGVVVGIQAGFIDVVFDIAFIGGGTLGGRCSNYRGTSLLPSHILNLTDMQFIQSPTGPNAVAANGHSAPASHAPQTNGHHRENGHAPSAGVHPSYRGVAHHGIGSRGSAASARGRGGPTRILSRGAMTGQFAAAARGDQSQAYSAPVSQQTNLLSSFGATLSYINVEGRPPPVKKQDYTNVAPPASLAKSDALPSRGRGGTRARPGIGSRGRDINGHGSERPTNGEAADVTPSPRGSAHRGGAPRGRGRGRGRGQSTTDGVAATS